MLILTIRLMNMTLAILIGKNALRWAEEKLGGRANVLLMLNDSDEFLKTERRRY